MRRSCIVYTSDESYLFPTLVSAIQARHFSDPEKADVFIFCLGLSSHTQEVFLKVCSEEGIQMVCLSEEAIEGESAMLARLFLNRFVPEQYQQYLYLDGDTQIYDSLDPLLGLHVPEGRFLAANDPTSFLLGDRGFQSRDLSAHLASIGLTPTRSLSYFNSGVLRINRQGWDAIGEEAWEYYKRNKTISRFPDQDALNLIGGDARLPLSLIWNFPAFMYNFLQTDEISPRIVHFMSNPKPWHGSFPPWQQGACEAYARAVTKYPALGSYHLPLSGSQRASYHLRQHWKKVTERVTWGWGVRRRRILSYEETCTQEL